VNGRETARSDEWAQHFSNASCSLYAENTSYNNLNDNAKQRKTKNNLIGHLNTNNDEYGCLKNLRERLIIFIAIHYCILSVVFKKFYRESVHDEIYFAS